MKIPADMLKPETLRAIVLEYVTREGTDYGHRDWDMEDKVVQVLGQIERGEVVILADHKTHSCNLVTVREANRALSR